MLWLWLVHQYSSPRWLFYFQRDELKTDTRVVHIWEPMKFDTVNDRKIEDSMPTSVPMIVPLVVPMTVTTIALRAPRTNWAVCSLTKL